jgi:hypothetical protein
MGDGRRAAQIQASRAAQQIVRETVASARRIGDEAGLDPNLVLQVAAHRLHEFAFGVAVTRVRPEDFLEKEVRIVRFANPSS